MTVQVAKAVELRGSVACNHCRANAELIVAIANPKDGRTLRDFVERVLLALCDEMTKLIDHPNIAEHSMGTAMMKLFNALANYRDSRWEDR
jgi:hypothetical protein